MSKMELYHFHKEGIEDHLWEEGKEILVPPTFKSTTYKRYQEFSTAIPTDSGKLNYHDLVNLLMVSQQLDQETILTLLQNAYKVSFYANEFKRETALENYRLKKFADLPSRLHCMYLTDEKGIDAWKGKFGTSKLVLYRMEVEGLIFKTNEQLLPLETLSYQDAYSASYNYWHPNLKKVPDDSNEYLFQGKAKILERIK